jgi:hypothetical protein
MTDKNIIDKVADSIKETVDKTRDTINEARHRGAAEIEAEKRAKLGDNMTSSEKLESMAEELKHRTQAEIDEAKRTHRG